MGQPCGEGMALIPALTECAFQPPKVFMYLKHPSHTHKLRAMREGPAALPLALASADEDAVGPLTVVGGSCSSSSSGYGE